MNIPKICCCFNHRFGLLANFLSSFWCIFARVFPSKLRVYTCFQGVHPFHLPCVRTIHAPSLAYCACHILATNKDILLTSMRNRSQGNTVLPLFGSPTPNDLRSSWDFLLGRSPNMLVGPTPPTSFKVECSLVLNSTLVCLYSQQCLHMVFAGFVIFGISLILSFLLT